MITYILVSVEFPVGNSFTPKKRTLFQVSAGEDMMVSGVFEVER